MKKTVIFTFLICFALTGALTVIYTGLRGIENNVYIERTDSNGNKSFAEGIEINASVIYASEIGWDTVYYPYDESKQSSKFNLKPDRNAPFEYFTYYSDGIDGIWSGYSISAGGELIDSLGGFGSMVNEILPSVPNGSFYEVTLNLKDYYDYYPLGALMDHEGFEKNIYKFLQIPVLSDREVNLKINKNDKGEITRFEFGLPSTGITIPILETEQGIYFSVIGLTQEEMLALPFGYGIYYMPSSRDSDNNKVYEKMPYTVLELDPEAVSFETFFLSPDKKTIHVLTKEDSQWIAYMYDSEDFSLKDRFEMCPISGDDNYFPIGKSETNNVLYFVDGYMIYFTENDGRYDLKIKVELSEKMANDLLDFAWDGERLAVISYENNGTRLNVVTADGIVYSETLVHSMKNITANSFNWNWKIDLK